MKNLTDMEKYLGVRLATPEEAHNYHIVESIMNAMDDEAFNTALEIISAYVFSFRKERKIAYSRAYRLAKRLGVTVRMLDDWYNVDEYN